MDAEWLTGVVDHLNCNAGFGYVRTVGGQRGGQQRLIFVLGRSIRYADAAHLAVGSPVRIRVSGRGRVDELQLLTADEPR